MRPRRGASARVTPITWPLESSTGAPDSPAREPVRPSVRPTSAQAMVASGAMARSRLRRVCGPRSWDAASPGAPCGNPGRKPRSPRCRGATALIGRAGAPPTVVSTATSSAKPCALAATPRPSATTMAGCLQPSMTWRAVIQTPELAAEKAVPATVSSFGFRGETLAAKGEVSASGNWDSPGIGGGASGALARSCRPSARARIRATPPE